MPFIIKSSKSGARTAQVVDNNEPSSSDRAEIIDMLRGLTFKFEVKLADIIDGKSAPAASSGVDVLDSVANLEDQIAERVQRALKKSAAQPTGSTFRYYPESDDNRPKTLDTSSHATSSLETEATQLSDRLSRLGVKEKEQQVREESPFREPSKDTLKAVKFDQNYPTSKPLGPKQQVGVEPISAPAKPTLMIPPQIKQLPKAAAETPQAVTSPVEPAPPQKAAAPKERLPYKVGSDANVCCAWFEDSDTAYLARCEKAIVQITELIGHEKERLDASPGLTSVQVGQLLLAKSSDDNNWYRAIVEAKYGSKIAVDFVDWGMKEIVELKDLRNINLDDLSFEKIPPCAILVQIKDSEEEMIQEFSTGDSFFVVKVLSFDEVKKSFAIQLLHKTEG